MEPACVWVLRVAGQIKDSPVSFGSGEGATNEDTPCDGGVHGRCFSIILDPATWSQQHGMRTGGLEGGGLGFNIFAVFFWAYLNFPLNSERFGVKPKKKRSAKIKELVGAPISVLPNQRSLFAFQGRKVAL